MNPSLLAHLNPISKLSRRCRSVPAVSSDTSFSDSPKKILVRPPKDPKMLNSYLKAKKELKEELEEINSRFSNILDKSHAAVKSRLRKIWHQKVEKLDTVEEKIFELNMPRYYGWRSHILTEGVLPYDPLPFAQWVTRTHIADHNGLPDYYNNIMSSEQLDASVQQIKSQVEDALAFEFNHKQQRYKYNANQLEDPVFLENQTAKSVSQQLNRILTTNLSKNYPHLMEAQVDSDPRIEAFWFFGGFETPKEVRAARRGHFAKDWEEERVEQCMKYTGNPIFQVRHHKPLREIIPLEECMHEALDIPVEESDPRKLGYFGERQRATIIPGFWPGDPNEFGCLSYHYRGHLTTRPENYNDNEDALKAQAVYASFTWLYSQACYQGFSTFQDPTYPLVNQAIITNGQWWSFSTYQLNTTALNVDNLYVNPRKNMCWVTEPMKLFDSIEGETVHGLNEDVLKHLIKFYANVPETRNNIEMKPYLRKERIIANIEDTERRVWLEDKYKHLMSNRPRHRLPPEIYDWQRIYLIKFKTRPLDKKREPWERGTNMWMRRLDDHAPEYIPKCLRPYPKSRKKFANTYYPSVPELDEKITKYKIPKPHVYNSSMHIRN
ncbi:hypothetical protein QAD02_000844 [Eretmocerus hayati]|uniref:Uncharacterized protein n=1 Tax=Eretmocerus hayati TaxID=131215 RepID=A0ACC2NJ50_9HYME|nr:hypothetical protein QAD02_000844 [Eretmocerus hayati]